MCCRNLRLKGWLKCVGFITCLLLQFAVGRELSEIILQKLLRVKGNVYKQDAKIAEYEWVIGRLYAQNELLRKAYEAMKEQVADEVKKKND